MLLSFLDHMSHYGFYLQAMHFLSKAVQKLTLPNKLPNELVPSSKAKLIEDSWSSLDYSILPALSNESSVKPVRNNYSMNYFYLLD